MEARHRPFFVTCRSLQARIWSPTNQGKSQSPLPVPKSVVLEVGRTRQVKLLQWLSALQRTTSFWLFQHRVKSDNTKMHHQLQLPLWLEQQSHRSLKTYSQTSTWYPFLPPPQALRCLRSLRLQVGLSVRYRALRPTVLQEVTWRLSVHFLPTFLI